MNIIDIIDKKRLGMELSYDELKYAFIGYLNKDVIDYQMSSLLMAIMINSLTDKEVLCLTKIFVDSGDQLDFRNIGLTVDKHSTGGVGDKVTLILGPILASMGILFPKMSGRGLGYTGGTADKLESIPGININLTKDQIYDQIKNIGISLSTQTEDIVPLDKVIYDLRSASGTVASIPLIAVSIMSKKIACGSKIIFIDIKCGSGALINNMDDALKLEKLMHVIANHFNLDLITEITDMNFPLGNNIGNALEVLEAIDILKGKESSLSELCLNFAKKMALFNYPSLTEDQIYKLAKEKIKSGDAYNKFVECITYQGGDLNKLEISSNKLEVKSNKSGIIKSINALNVSKLAFNLGAGRLKKEDIIDYGAGITIEKNIGDTVNIDDILCTLYGNINIDFDIYSIFEIE